MAKLSKWAPTPHLHSRSSTQQIMNEFTGVIIAVSLFAVAVFFYEWGPDYAFKASAMLWVSIFAAIATELLYFYVSKKMRNGYELLKAVMTSYPIITALLFALCLPVGTPLAVVAMGAMASVFLGKIVFGGVGYNPFNPALVGRALVTVSWGGLLTTSLHVTDTAAMATPLVNLSQHAYIGTYEELVTPYGGMLGLLVGNYPSAIGESVSIAIILAGIYLIVRNIIDWRIPVFYVGTVFVMTWIIGAMNGVTSLWYPLFHVLAGGLLFGAIFMATDLVTSPVARKGKVLFAICLGILTVVIRLLGNYPEGVFFSILFMNLFKPIIDRSFMGRMSLPLTRHEKILWLVVALVVLGCSVLVGSLI